jgi:hypothetical protein
LNDGFRAVRIVRVADEKLALHALEDYAAYVGYSVDLFNVLVELDQKPMTPRCTNLVAVQVGNSLGFVTLQVEISRSAASSFVGADG